MSGTEMTPGEYISHHLINLTQKSPDVQSKLVDFSFVNIDTLFFSILTGVIAFSILLIAARKMQSGVPGRFQAAIELLIEFVDDSCKELIHNEKSRKMIAPLGLTIFVWIIFMNTMDLLPVDLLPKIWQNLSGDHHAYLRVVPTADLNTPMAMAISVLFLCIVYNIKIKGFGGWMHELFSVPFGNKIWLFIPNLVMNIIEFLSKTLSHGMRLFGNMYAGEIVFIVIALLGGTWGVAGAAGISDIVLITLQLIAGLAWAIFHILVIALQAYLFMVLTFVYLGQAHDSH
ncbi:F0F1 ATP synthase subunit A [Snodgrassella alvi]|jgi:F-type H+-transporting ATPase subunit a|uniref:ATP synthase subunit a n=1 Tax=Snodgrassella alvi TaxID=1196083 RepID=A0A855FZV8_9NEIS|nr:F0F1 ATP synthase subunit A [Snodgrassella alvi]PIT62749.1 F0F1 ATP synthase subunit A [Snodgrassella alvi]